MQDGKDNESLPNKSISATIVDNYSNKCPPRLGSFICFQQKVKSSIVDPPALRSILIDELLTEPLISSQLEYLNQEQLSLFEPINTSAYLCSATQRQEDLNLSSEVDECEDSLHAEDMYKLLSEELYSEV